MSTGVAMTAAVAHLMELPAKMKYEPPLYVRLHRTLYWNFGKAAGPAESLAVATTAALAWRERQRQPGSRRGPWAAVAAGCLVAAHGIFWSVVQPVNVEMVRWPLQEIPQDWTRWRDRWEYGHAVRAGLIMAAFAALTMAAVNDTNQRSNA